MRRLTHGLLLAALSLGLLAATVRYGSFVAGGSDSYCYVHQAERWASGRLLVPEPLALAAPWPAAAATFTPAGHLPSLTAPGAIVPICPPGFSMLMALFQLAGGPAAVFAVVPLCGVALLWATYWLGSRVSRDVGLAAAFVTASSPIVLYQVIQPMSDVPAAAFWVLALAAASGTGAKSAPVAGLCAALAILIRPNLLPLGVVIGIYLLVRPSRSRAERVRDGALFALGSALGCVAVAAVQAHFHGSPLASGYGDLGTIFASANVAPNARRYATWLVQAQTPLILLAVVGPLVLRGALTALWGAFCVATAAVYLPYLVFDDWSYLRFLLPAIPVSIVLMMATVHALAGRAGARWATAALALSTGILLVAAVPEAGRRQAFRLGELEADYSRVGVTIGRRLPENALVITSRYSGSVRYYAGRKTLTWDALDPAWLDRAVAFVEARGFEPYLVLASAEEAAFRQRFADSGLGRLDWPPMIEIAPQVRVYEPEARERYLKGERVATAYVR